MYFLKARDMLLVIDFGNTNVVFAVCEGDHIKGSWRCASNTKRTADEYAVWLTQLMILEDVKPGDITGAIIASVVPQALFNIKTLCERYFRTEPLVVGTDNVNLGLEVIFDRPSQVGADRLATAVAAHKKFQGPLIVIDFGTATTFEVVDIDGNYQGGVIAPGINLSAEALHMGSAQLPRIEILRTDEIIGKTTVAAMRSGVFWGYIGMIEGLVTRIKTECGVAMTVVATGGLAPLFAESTDMIDETDSNLTVAGLIEIYERNQTL
jgi:type III pantothenate kinase|tara:strand:- start:226 stop:1023 length:798 start_codon:yes stop_codon:yes gene_type:complete